MFLATDYGEYLLKLIHVLLHSLTVALVGKLAFRYFKNDRLKAQMVCFIMLANDDVRLIYHGMSNDSIVTVYVVLAIYFLTSNRPLISSLMLTVALSIKAGAILLIPGFLGFI